MSEREKTIKIKMWGKILLLFLILVVMLTYFRTKGDLKVVSNKLDDVVRKLNFFKSSKTKDAAEEKAILKFKPNPKYPESHLDIKVNLAHVQSNDRRAITF